MQQRRPCSHSEPHIPAKGHSEGMGLVLLLLTHVSRGPGGGRGAERRSHRGCLHATSMLSACSEGCGTYSTLRQCASVLQEFHFPQAVRQCTVEVPLPTALSQCGSVR